MSKQNMKQPSKRGATGVAYGLVVGLIAIVALGAITNIGGEVDGLFTTVGDQLGDVATDANNAVPTPTPSAEALAETSIITAGSDIDIIGGTSPGSCVDFTVQNSSGSATTGPLSWAITQGSGNFQAGSCSDTCTGNTLGPGATCTFGLQPVASANGTYTGEATVYMHGGAYTVDQVALDGRASGFTQGLVAYPPQCENLSEVLANGSCANLSDGFAYSGGNLRWNGLTWDDNCTNTVDAQAICMLLVYGNQNPGFNSFPHPTTSSTTTFASPYFAETFLDCPASHLSFAIPLANSSDFNQTHSASDNSLNTVTCRWNSY